MTEITLEQFRAKCQELADVEDPIDVARTEFSLRPGIDIQASGSDCLIGWDAGGIVTGLPNFEVLPLGRLPNISFREIYAIVREFTPRVRVI